jgi:hypothetical protein
MPDPAWLVGETDCSRETAGFLVKELRMRLNIV